MATFLENRHRISDEGVVALLELSAPSFSDTLRIIDDNVTEFLFDGLPYTGYPFYFATPADTSGSASQMKIEITNIGRSITEDLETLLPGDIVRAKLTLVDRSDPSIARKVWRVPLSNVSVTMAVAQANCGNFQLMKQPASRLRYDQYFSPGNF